MPDENNRAFEEEMIPINAIITTVCLNIFSNTDVCYFSEIKSRVEKEAGSVGDGFLAGTLDDLGFKVNDRTQPWVVRS
jgi:hypothetical protein